MSVPLGIAFDHLRVDNDTGTNTEGLSTISNANASAGEEEHLANEDDEGAGDEVEEDEVITLYTEEDVPGVLAVIKRSVPSIAVADDGGDGDDEAALNKVSSIRFMQVACRNC